MKTSIVDKNKVFKIVWEYILMENSKVKLKLNQLQPRIFDNNPASIRGFSYEADGNSDKVKVVH